MSISRFQTLPLAVSLSILVLGFANENVRAETPPSSAPPSTSVGQQVATNQLLWEGREVDLASSIAWQEERDGRWVTVVLVTDRPVPPASIKPGVPADEFMKLADVQGIAFPVMSGGVPPDNLTFDVAYRTEDGVSTTSVNGAGGFEISAQSPERIAGKAVFSPALMGEQDSGAFSVSFDAPIIGGDAVRMADEGEALGVTGGDPGRDLLAAQKARLIMDYDTISSYASPELQDFLADESNRAKNLEMLKQMTPAESKILGGLRRDSEARLYWLQQRPGAINSRCIDAMTLLDGRWRSTASACQSE